MTSLAAPQTAAAEVTWEDALYESLASTRDAINNVAPSSDSTDLDSLTEAQTAVRRIKEAIAILTKNLLILNRWAHTVSSFTELEMQRNVVIERWTLIVSIYAELVGETMTADQLALRRTCGLGLQDLRSRIDSSLRTGVDYHQLGIADTTRIRNFTLPQCRVPELPAQPPMTASFTDPPVRGKNATPDTPVTPSKAGAPVRRGILGRRPRDTGDNGKYDGC